VPIGDLPLLAIKPIHTDIFRNVSVRFQALNIGHAAINSYTYKGVRDEDSRKPADQQRLVLRAAQWLRPVVHPLALSLDYVGHPHVKGVCLLVRCGYSQVIVRAENFDVLCDALVRPRCRLFGDDRDSVQ